MDSNSIGNILYVCRYLYFRIKASFYSFSTFIYFHLIYLNVHNVLDTKSLEQKAETDHLLSGKQCIQIETNSNI